MVVYSDTVSTRNLWRTNKVSGPKSGAIIFPRVVGKEPGYPKASRLKAQLSCIQTVSVNEVGIRGRNTR